MKHNGYDFAGWVTKYNVLCLDGRTIKNNSFAHQDGKKVPLVYNHIHDNIREVLGYTILENRPNEGVFGYSYCNSTDSGMNAKETVAHGDLDSYSIYATRLQEMGGNVYKGNIKEVSIVLAGANPEAMIQNVALQHDDGSETVIDEAVICFNEPFDELSHSEDEEYDEEYDKDYDEELEPEDDEYSEDDEEYDEEEDDEYDEDYDEELEPEDDEYPEGDEEYDEDAEEDEYDDEYDEEYELEHADGESERTIEDVLNELTDEQKRTFIFILSELYNNKENNEMKHNSFYDEGMNVLTHADADDIIERAKSAKTSSFKDFFNQAVEEAGFTHSETDGIDYATDVQDYGVNDPSFLFPDAKTLDIPPRFIQRDMGWVSTFMSGTKHSPFSRLKSMFADITEDEARARGYIKGKQKYPELIKLLKRVTTPQTVYKMQKFDRDDMIDITDFNLKNWILPEMRMMLNEEIARAALIGDGRESTDPYKINESNIRPIYKDASLFSIHAQVVKGTGTPDEIMAGTAKNIRRAILKAKKLYKGSGNMTFFTTEDWKTEMLLIDDGIGHPLYKTEQELATALGVTRIVTVPVMENVSSNNMDLIGIALNLGDYTFGATAGGAIENFEDFDIDFNQYKFLMEGRTCGCLTVPYSAIILEVASDSSSDDSSSDDDGEDDGEG